jgi:hypothetical protein
MENMAGLKKAEESRCFAFSKSASAAFELTIARSALAAV